MSESTDTGPEPRTEPNVSPSDKYAHLNGFPRDLLHALAHVGPCSGLDLKRHLMDYYGEDVNHGRLYPNLDKLVEKGFVAKESVDGRTNGYALTDAGRDALAARRTWENEVEA